MKITIKNADYSKVGLGKSSVTTLSAFTTNYFENMVAAYPSFGDVEKLMVYNLITRIDTAGIGGKVRAMYLFIGNEYSQAIDLVGNNNPLTFGGNPLNYSFTPYGMALVGGQVYDDAGYADTGYRPPSDNVGLFVGIKGLESMYVTGIAGANVPYGRHALLFATDKIVQGSSDTGINITTSAQPIMTMSHSASPTDTGTANTCVNSLSKEAPIELTFPNNFPDSMFIGKVNGYKNQLSFGATVQHAVITDYLSLDESKTLNALLAEFNLLRQ